MSNKLFILNYSNELGSREVVKGAIDSIPEIPMWRFDLPNCFYLVSALTAKEVALKIREKLPNGRFIVTLMGEDYWGWNNEETWYLFEHKWIKPEQGS